MLQDGGWHCQPVALCALPGHRPLCGLRDMRWLCLVVHMGSCASSPPTASTAIDGWHVLGFIVVIMAISMAVTNAQEVLAYAGSKPCENLA